MKTQSKAEGPFVTALVGATAVGKTELALQLAARLDGEIVSADARTFYRGMDIGTAKPRADERRRVRHHLIDTANPDESWSLAQFQQEAYKAIDSILERGKLPILVGGSGQYMRAMTAGWLPPEVAPNVKLRGILERWAEEIGVEELHKRLAHLDADAAGRMEPRNLRRIVRALEVIFSTGEKFSAQGGIGEPRYDILQIGLRRSREVIYARIDARLDGMMRAGFLEEVRGLLERGYSPDLPSFSAIGYRQLADHLAGKIALDEALMQIRSISRRFVRRQANWFKEDDLEIHWFDLDNEADAAAKVERLIRERRSLKHPT